MSEKRKVQRVLVMLDYGPDSPDSGEVFDLTALVSEMHQKAGGYWADIRLAVKSEKSWKVDGYVFDTVIEWSSMYPNHTGTSSHLADVINSAMPDGPRVEDLRKKVKKLRDKANTLEYEARQAKIEQAAQIRAQHPIAKVTQVPVLAEVAAATLEEATV